MGYEVTKENMSTHSFKYDGLITKISELNDEVAELKNRLSEQCPTSSKTFVENEEVHIEGNFCKY